MVVVIDQDWRRLFLLLGRDLICSCSADTASESAVYNTSSAFRPRVLEVKLVAEVAVADTVNLP